MFGGAGAPADPAASEIDPGPKAEPKRGWVDRLANGGGDARPEWNEAKSRS